MKYYITSLCILQSKYSFIKDKWIERTKNKCKNGEIIIFEHNYIDHNIIWKTRLEENIKIIKKSNLPIVMCDLDVIIEKDIQPLVTLPYDIIISQEIGNNKAYPQDCSSILGFGACMGFAIFKPTAFFILERIYNDMIKNTYYTQDDQVVFMKTIVNNSRYIDEEEIILENKKYKCKIINVLTIKICVLHPDIIVRDPILNINQYANHINLDNVGGPFKFLEYFDKNLEELPLTCRCGKIYLGDNSICKHIDIRNNKK